MEEGIRAKQFISMVSDTILAIIIMSRKGGAEVKGEMEANNMATSANAEDKRKFFLRYNIIIIINLRS